MSFCPVCGSELKPEATTCPVCGTSVAVQPQPPVNTQPHKKAKKKKKNLGIKITAAVLAVIILAVSGLFIADNIMYKNEIEAEEYITDFPVLKTETDFVVFDEEDFPSTDYSIKVERVLYGGILKSELFKQTKIIIDDTSTDPVYHIDFEKDGEYIITLEDNTDEEPETTLDFSEDTDYEADTDTDENDVNDEDDDAPSKVVIKVTVDNDDDEAIGSVDLDSKPGDDPVEIPSDEEEPTTEDESDSAPQEYKELIGTYKGSYFAGQGETGLTLTVYMEDEQCKALFDFYNLPGQNNAQSGKYYMDVVYDETSDTYSFNATEWIEKPSTYVFINLKGQLVGDVLSGDSPTRFSVSKATDDNDTTTDDITNVTGDWVSAYQEFLINYEVDEYVGENAVFTLCYIDYDDIPELIVGVNTEYSCHADSASVYTYYNGNVSFVCKGGQYGEICYAEKENMVCGIYSGMGTAYNETYKIQNGTGVCIWKGFNDRGNVMEEEDTTYKSNDVVVTREEYEEAIDEFYPYDRLSSSSDNCYPLTEHYINNYVTE